MKEVEIIHLSADLKFHVGTNRVYLGTNRAFLGTDQALLGTDRHLDKNFIKSQTLVPPIRF